MNITGIRESDWNKDGTIVKVSNVAFDDGREVPGYDLPPGLEAGKPMPEGWEIATGKSGKPYIKYPKPGGKGGGFGGGAAAFRNTAEGQRAEQDSIHRSVALTQAVALGGPGTLPPDVLQAADLFFSWLRQTSGGAVPASTATIRSAQPSQVEHNTASPGSTPQPESAGDKTRVGEKAADAGAGVSREGGPDSCTHNSSTTLEPDGKPLPLGFFRCLDCGYTRKATA